MFLHTCTHMHTHTRTHIHTHTHTYAHTHIPADVWSHIRKGKTAVGYNIELEMGVNGKVIKV